MAGPRSRSWRRGRSSASRRRARPAPASASGLRLGRSRSWLGTPWCLPYQVSVVINNFARRSQVCGRIRSMSNRSYGQFCGLARALELVGERWALLVVRDLFCGPKRFTDLRRGLPRIPTNILSARLKELEDAGIVRRRLLPRPAAGVSYEPSESGQAVEDIGRRP